MFKWLIALPILLAASIFLSYLYYDHVQQVRLRDPRYLIAFIQGVSLTEDRIQDDLLKEIVFEGQSGNLYEFNCAAAEDALIKTALIESTRVTKEFPDKLQITYRMRKPIALLSEKKNRAVDRSGALFPFHPYYSARPLPKLLLGEVDFSIAARILDLAAEMLPGSLRLIFLDVSEAENSSLGRRQVLFDVEDRASSSCDRLRLHHKEAALGLHNYLRIRDHSAKSEKNRIIDLRLNQLAYITEEDAA